MEAIQTLFQLRWSQKPQFRHLPAHVERTFVSTGKGDLELLVCRPKTTTISGAAPPIFFVHGGYGCAGVWLEWMTYLYEHDYQGCTYAYSARNHGASYAVPYFQMVFATPLSEIASDLAACVYRAEHLHANASKMVIVAHSAGGGVSQYALAAGSIAARALCLVGAVPHFGMADMYWNWFKHDPMFPLRSVLHFGHPSSPLSTLPLIQSAFFGSAFSRVDMPAFMQWLPCYESMGWPIGQFGSFWNWLCGRNTWLSPSRILAHMELSRNTNQKDTVCIIVGSEDMMYRECMYKRVAKEYRDGLRELMKSHKIDSMVCGCVDDEMCVDTKALSISRNGGVRIALVHKAGHHVQNDVQNEVAAEALLSWVLQV